LIIIRRSSCSCRFIFSTIRISDVGSFHACPKRLTLLLPLWDRFASSQSRLSWISFGVIPFLFRFHLSSVNSTIGTRSCGVKCLALLHKHFLTYFGMFCKSLLVKFPPAVRALSTHTSIFFDVKIVATLIYRSIIFIRLRVVRRLLVVRLIIRGSLRRLSWSLKSIIRSLWSVPLRLTRCSLLLFFIS